MIIPYRSTVKYQSQDTDFGRIYWSYSVLPFLLGLMCVRIFSSVQLITYVCSCNHHTLNTEHFHHDRHPWCCLSITTPSSLLPSFLPTSSLVTDLWKSCICSLFDFFSYQKCYINGFIRWITFGGWLFPPLSMILRRSLQVLHVSTLGSFSLLGSIIRKYLGLLNHLPSKEHLVYCSFWASENKASINFTLQVIFGGRVVFCFLFFLFCFLSVWM